MASVILPNQPVVIDNGSGSIKAGFAGEDGPRVVFPNYVGVVKHSRVMAGGIVKDSLVGSDAQKYRGLLALRYPMEHGIVTDWNAMQQIWEFAYSPEQLNCNSADHPVLLSEAPLNPLQNREKAMEIFFETFGVPSIHVQMQAVLSLYAAGRTTGVVLDSGDGVTHSVPVYEGFAIEPAIQRIDVAGRDVTNYLKLLLRKEGHIFHRSNEFELVREMKESICQVLPYHSNITKEDPVKSYTMADGQTIRVGNARFQAPEVLFRPEIIGLEYCGLAQCINNSISMSDTELRKELYNNILLSGGSTLFPGFGERVLHEVRKHIPADLKVRISAPQERIHSTWTGGSILATLDTFRKIVRTKAQYENEGKNLARKAY
uniref:Actin n=2 Tax=Bursaphelenchus xylophilus TaxID=6326 RepID=A0A1I7RI42_BURXY